jgi:hypothetical protein
MAGICLESLKKECDGSRLQGRPIQGPPHCDRIKYSSQGHFVKNTGCSGENRTTKAILQQLNSLMLVWRTAVAYDFDTVEVWVSMEKPGV